MSLLIAAKPQNFRNLCIGTKFHNVSLLQNIPIYMVLLFILIVQIKVHEWPFILKTQVTSRGISCRPGGE